MEWEPEAVTPNLEAHRHGPADGGASVADTGTKNTVDPAVASPEHRNRRLGEIRRIRSQVWALKANHGAPGELERGLEPRVELDAWARDQGQPSVWAGGSGGDSEGWWIRVAAAGAEHEPGRSRPAAHSASSSRIRLSHFA